MRKPTTLIVIRHGETLWNASRKLQGGANVHLSKLGKLQASQTGTFLAAFSIHHIYSSPLARALDTAKAIQKIHPRVKLSTSDLLLERGFGKLEGLSYEDVMTAHPRMAFGETWNYPHFAPAGAEALADVVRRASDFLKTIEEKHKSETIAVVAHGVSIRCIVSQATGIPLAPKRDMWLGNASVSILQKSGNGHWDLHLYNYTSHLTQPSSG